MGFRRVFCSCLYSFLAIVLAVRTLRAQAPAQPPSLSSTSSASKQIRKSPSGAAPKLDAGAISNGVYRNASFGFACKIPPGWVLRTEEMNRQEGEDNKADDKKAAGAGRVLLAAFSRPPQAQGEDVNASILIAAESAASVSGAQGCGAVFRSGNRGGKGAGIRG